MPRDPSIRKVLVIGSGPIVIGQAAEFDYSGSQACRALREEGVEVVLVNSNPATIMTDLETADQVYIEPLNVAHLEAIIARERPDGLLATLGGQTGLNLAVRLAEEGVLERYGVRILGTSYQAIRQAEDRELFKELMEEIGIPVPRSQVVYSPEEALGFAEEVGYPVIVRPGYTLGGTGGGICHSPEDLRETVSRGLVHSLNNQCLVEESVLGLKEIEWEVMRDGKDNCITVCDMENLDPMGVHTGDSIVVAPSLTLTDPEYQFLRSKALAIIRALKIEGGCNIQFALDPQSGRYYVIEVNPRVSRSSALASKATGYPIARVAAKIALGLTLDEIENRVTGKTRASFEPALDYVVVKFPKWPFDKFREADRTLGTQMKATGEVMAIDRTFEGAFMKALWSLEVKLTSLRTNRWKRRSDEELRHFIRQPTDGRMFAILEALHRGFTVEEISELSRIDPYFIRSLARLVRAEQEFYAPALTPKPALVAEGAASSVEAQGEALASTDGEGGNVPTKAEALRELLARAGETASERERHALRRAIGELGIDLRELKALGFSDQLIMAISGLTHDQLSLWKRMFNVRPVYKAVDTCAAEFAASTPYYYSTWATMDDRSQALAEAPPADRGAVVVIGSGPIRIGQGIEFDYCSVHAVMALRRMGFRAVMVNNNPETVSTDYDVSDALYFEPLTLEHVLEVVRRERALGVICQFGGQTAINLAGPLAGAGVRLLGTDLEGIDLTEDREKFDRLLEELGISRPPGLATADYDQAVREARRIGFPVLVRPSYVLGGRAMRIIHSEEALREWIEHNRHAFAGKPILIDKFIRGREVEVDLITDGETVVIPGLMEHIERAGVHSGDSMAVYPPQTLTLQEEYQVVQSAIRIARAIKARGLMNIQFVLTPERLYVLEVNPRASRTVPFMSKITGVPMVALATRAIMGEITGQSLANLGVMGGLYAEPGLTAVKAPVFSSSKLTRTEVELGPEMKSTGEVMGIGRSYYEALRKALVAAGISLPEASPVSWQQNGMEDEKRPGSVLITVADRDKEAAVPLAWGFSLLGFRIYATRGTARYLREQGIEVEEVKKISEGSPHIVDLIHQDRFALVVNTVSDNQQAEQEGLLIRRAAVERGIPLMTSLDTAAALLRALRATAEGLATGVSVTPLSAIRSRYPDL